MWWWQELEGERQESERDCGMMKMKLDKENFCCQLLAFWKKENKTTKKKPVWKLLHQSNMKQFRLGAESEGKRRRDSGGGIIDKMRRWCGEARRHCWPWIQENCWVIAGTPCNGDKKLSFRKKEGSRITFLCPIKRYIWAQGRNQQRKKQFDEWYSAENSSSEPSRWEEESRRSLWHLGSSSKKTGLWGDTTSTVSKFCWLYLQHITKGRIYLTTSTCHLPPDHSTFLPGFLQ